MRWKDKPISKVGDKKIVTKFLWFPKKINRETRWLEKATWEEEYQQICESEEECYSCLCSCLCKWIETKWINYPPKETERFKNKLYKNTEGKKGDN